MPSSKARNLSKWFVSTQLNRRNVDERRARAMHSLSVSDQGAFVHQALDTDGILLLTRAIGAMFVRYGGVVLSGDEVIVCLPVQGGCVSWWLVRYGGVFFTG